MADATHSLQCANVGGTYPDDQVIDGCTSLIRSGSQSSVEEAGSFLNRGYAYARKGERDRAIADYGEAIRLDPKNERAFAARGGALAGKRDYQGAIADANEAVGLAPRNADILNSRCWFRAIAGLDLELARKDCDLALRLSHRANGAILDSRGMIGLKQQRWQEAWDYYDAANAVEPDFASALYGRGVAALRLGRNQEGRDDLAAAQEIDPEIAETYRGYGVTP